MFATTCQEILGSFIFLFIKHPYDVGDSVIIENSELVVERISLLYTVFTRVHTAREVHSPNAVLNSLWIDNITRSEIVKEQVPVYVAIGHMSETLKALATKMQAFRNEFHGADVHIRTVALREKDMVELHCEMHYRCPQSDYGLRTHLRTELMDAIVRALLEASAQRSMTIRTIPIAAQGKQAQQHGS